MIHADTQEEDGSFSTACGIIVFHCSLSNSDLAASIFTMISTCILAILNGELLYIRILYILNEDRTGSNEHIYPTMKQRYAYKNKRCQ
jgi:hypothetical protein